MGDIKVAITVTVKAETIDEAMNALESAFVGAIDGVKKTQAPLVLEDAPESVSDPVGLVLTSEQEREAVQEPEAPVEEEVTKQQVKVALQTFIKANGAAGIERVKAILEGYGAKNLDGLDESFYADVLASLNSDS